MLESRSRKDVPASLVYRLKTGEDERGKVKRRERRAFQKKIRANPQSDLPVKTDNEYHI
jgi:hypothetical protein